MIVIFWKKYKKFNKFVPIIVVIWIIVESESRHRLTYLRFLYIHIKAECLDHFFFITKENLTHHIIILPHNSNRSNRRWSTYGTAIGAGHFTLWSHAWALGVRETYTIWPPIVRHNLEKKSVKNHNSMVDDAGIALTRVLCWWDHNMRILATKISNIE